MQLSNDRFQGRNPARRLVMDLDGTICSSMGFDDYSKVKPVPSIIGKVNELYEKGWHVTIHTARGMNTYKGDVQAVETALRSITEYWLEKHGVKYDALLFGKPQADVYVDDKGLKPFEFACSGL